MRVAYIRNRIAVQVGSVIWQVANYAKKAGEGL